jgi:hypothetical protein
MKKARRGKQNAGVNAEWSEGMLRGERAGAAATLDLELELIFKPVRVSTTKRVLL